MLYVIFVVFLQQKNAHMVTYRDVGKRHAVYGAGVIAVATLAQFSGMLTVVLFAALGAVRWHMGTPLLFCIAACACGPACAALCVNLSVHTFWFAHGMPWLSVPTWLPAVHGLFAHWALDLYFLVTLRDVRKTTLP